MRRELSLVGVTLVAYACVLVLGSLVICQVPGIQKYSGEFRDPSGLVEDGARTLPGSPR
jgi:hypothetical protein